MGTRYTKHPSFRARTTRVSILFAPLAFVPQRQLWSSEPLSPQVFLPISTHFTATPGIPLTSSTLQHRSFRGRLQVEPGDFTADLRHRLRAFTPNNSEQRSPPPYYRGCWHGVSRGFFLRYRHCFRPVRKEFTSQGTSSSTRRCCVRVSPIAQNSPLLPPVGVWTVFQFQCGRAPSQAGYRSMPW